MNTLLKRIIIQLDTLRPQQVANLYYTLYGKNLASLDFTATGQTVTGDGMSYMEDIEAAMTQKASEFDFEEIVKVLATIKFQQKSLKNLEFGDNLEQRVIDIIEQLVPHEIRYLLRYFYNSKTNIGLSDKVGEKLESVIRVDAPEMNADELSKPIFHYDFILSA